MRTLTYYVAATLDGYIAGPDGEFDFFPFEGGLMEAVLKVGITSPYSHLEQHVVSSALRVEDPDVQVVSDPVALVRELKLRDGMGIWLAGGGKLAAALRDEIDELVIKRNPIVIGSGISLIEGPFTPTPFVPAWSRELDGGVRIQGYIRKL